MMIDIERDSYTQEDVEAAFSTGMNVSRDLERYQRDVEETLRRVKGYDHPDKPMTLGVIKGLLKDYRDAAVLVGRVWQLESTFHDVSTFHGVASNYMSRMESDLQQIKEYLEDAFERLRQISQPVPVPRHADVDGGAV